ncbi:lipid droplet-regulating VLDL assembly factor AUP1 homolog isoform X2 [Uloborus diversus]|uniref:lipid droplet-regulating VLDL assembly factor AUP1 homolog isoform X2 n=1 Tax=Uloborus diversus TaxID=327109 RepID=UPI00240A91EA|nr:lipid droplet-regulating VLDL assembly factor AUP1 homolog isoform X2 [Uloborus diversus]
MSDIQQQSGVPEEELRSSVNIEQLFDISRIKEKNGIYKVALYFPFGFLLFLMRLVAYIVGVVTVSLLPRSSSFRCKISSGICKVLGIVVKIDDKYLDDSTKLLVANHVSILDRMAVNSFIPCNIITNNFQVDTYALFFWRDVDTSQLREPQSSDIGILQKCIEESPIPSLNFPECATTNGRVGILKFHPTIFSLNFPVQPVLIEISLSSFVNVHSSVLGSSAWSDMFWLLFFPSTFYTLKVLPSMMKNPEEPVNEFSKRVQQTMSNAAGLSSCIYSFADKAELIKRLRTSRSSSASSTSTNVSNIAAQVPHSSTDQDMNALLLKHFHEKLTLNTAAKTFGKSPKERMLSYQERKTLLIAAAKRKYMEKQGLL